MHRFKWIRTNGCHSLACCFLAFLVYFNTLTAEFVYDDRRAILSNPDLRCNTPWSQLLFNDYWGTPLVDSGSHGSYRPLTVLTFRLNYLIGELHPFGYHLVNVILHCSATVMLMKIVEMLLPRCHVGRIITGALFATHPIHTEAVAGVVGRADLLACNFFFLSLLAYLCYIQYCSNCHKKRKLFHTWTYFTASILCSICALLSKETGITVLGMILIFDYLYNKKNRIRNMILILCLIVLISWARLQMRSYPKFAKADNPTAKEPNVFTRFLTFSYLPLLNFMMLCYPAHLSFDWSMEAIPRVTTLDFRVIYMMIFYAFLIGTTILSVKNRDNLQKLILFAIFLMVIPFLPAINMFFYVGFVIAERILYIPSAGFCVLYGIASEKFKNSKYFWMGTVIVFCGFISKTYLRNLEWNDEELLYRSAITYNPPKAYGNLGVVLNEKGRRKEAEEAFKMALMFRPNMAEVHYNLAILLYAEKRNSEAILSFQRAIHFRPTLALAYYNLGQLLISERRYDEAINILSHTNKLDGNGVKNRKEFEYAKISSLVLLGSLYRDRNKLRQALEVFQQAATNAPRNAVHNIFNMIGEIHCRLHEDVEAERWYLASLEADPQYVLAYVTYGKLLAKNVSRILEAEQWFKRAQRLAPEDPAVYHHYGAFLAVSQRYSEAAHMYQRAAELLPLDYELSVAVAIAMRQAGRKSEAETWYRKSVGIRPKDPRGYSNLGAILHINGKFKEAEQSYKKALALKPNDTTTLANLHRLNEIMTKF